MIETPKRLVSTQSPLVKSFLIQYKNFFKSLFSTQNRVVFSEIKSLAGPLDFFIMFISIISYKAILKIIYDLSCLLSQTDLYKQMKFYLMNLISGRDNRIPPPKYIYDKTIFPVKYEDSLVGHLEMSVFLTVITIV
jgi:hypothetical protein